MSGLDFNKTTTPSFNTLSHGYWWTTSTIDPLQIPPHCEAWLIIGGMDI
jgi:hypothetical protein